MAYEKAMFYVFIQSPIGQLLLIADDLYVQVVAFCKGNRVSEELAYWSRKLSIDLVQEESSILETLQHELNYYFMGKLQCFSVPYDFKNFTPFQKSVLKEVTVIPYGSTTSYKQLASQVSSPKAYRAVGGANGANRLAIIIPCHRVVAHNGKLGGYAYGVNKKLWLLKHERSNL